MAPNFRTENTVNAGKYFQKNNALIRIQKITVQPTRTNSIYDTKRFLFANPHSVHFNLSIALNNFAHFILISLIAMLGQKSIFFFLFFFFFQLHKPILWQYARMYLCTRKHSLRRNIFAAFTYKFFRLLVNPRETNL